MDLEHSKLSKHPTECVVAIQDIEKIHQEIHEIIDDYQLTKNNPPTRDIKEIMSTKYKIAAITAGTAIITAGITATITLTVALKDCN
jgi:hypothetical protein